MADTVLWEHDDTITSMDLGHMLNRANAMDYVESGLTLIPDYTVPDVDVGTGSAENEARVSDSDNEGWVVRPNGRSNLALSDNATNYVYLAFNPKEKGDTNETGDDIYIHIDTDQTPPSDPSLLLGTVDTSADSKTEKNRDPDITAQSIQTDSISTTNVAGKAHNTSNQSISTATVTKVELDTIDHNDDNVTVDTANNNIDINTAGKYLIQGVIRWGYDSNWATGDECNVSVYLNGSALFSNTDLKIGDDEQTVATPMVYKELSAGDTIHTSAFQNSGSPIDLFHRDASDNYLNVVKIA